MNSSLAWENLAESCDWGDAGVLEELEALCAIIIPEIITVVAIKLLQADLTEAPFDCLASIDGA
jgi:hypothetical protein